MAKNLIVMALQSECRGFFSAYNPVYTGVGKVNAAYHLLKAIQEHQPDRVINLGSAGSTTFNAGALVNCTSFIQRDMDVTPLGFEKWQTPFDESGSILEYGNRVNDLPEGICGTGDSFDTSGKKEAYNLVDMEAYALAKICQAEGIPFTCIKFISDGADGQAHQDWEKSLQQGAELMSNWLENYL